MKLTKRKGFNFFRSYWDVYNELDDKDKLAFIDALLNKQFLNIDPTNLTGMAKFAYISQTNSIDGQVKGYNDKMKSLGKAPLGVIDPPYQGGSQGGVNTPTEQEKEKVKEKGEGEGQQKEVYDLKTFLEDWNTIRAKELKTPSNLNYLSSPDKQEFNALAKAYNQEQFKNALTGLFKQKEFPNGNTSMQSNPGHFLKFFNSYLTAFNDRNVGLYGKQKVEI